MSLARYEDNFKNNNPKPSLREIYDAISISKKALNQITSVKNDSEIEKFLALKSKADDGLINAQFEVGTCYDLGLHVKKSSKLACRYYKLAADQGHSGAQVLLALLYEDGYGVQQSYAKAFHYYKLAADQGDSTALAKLGDFYANGNYVDKSIGNAVYFFKLAASQGSMTAFEFLAEAYDNGIGVEKSQKQANFYHDKIIAQYKNEADSGDAEAQATLAYFYANGVHVQKSLESAFFYYKLSASQNLPRGLYGLAECFAYGNGVEKSIGQAIIYYKQAVNFGYSLAIWSYVKLLLENNLNTEEAVHHLKLIVQKGYETSPTILAMCQYDLAECYEKGIGTELSSQSALYYYTLSADSGNMFALTKLGDVYLEGQLNLQKSPIRAVKYYELASLQGCPFALEMLGQCYERGEGVERSLEKAFHYYKQAAEVEINKGFNSSIFALARCYEKGIGVEKSLDLAIYYYKLAGENGHDSGYHKAGCCYQQMGGNDSEKNAAAYFKMSSINEKNERS